MKRRTWVALLVASLALPPALALARRKATVDPSLAKIDKIFIKGNDEAASNLRKILSGKTSKLDNFVSGQGSQGGCFELVGNEADADAVLEVGQEMTKGGLEGFTTVVSGSLTNKKGDLVWSDSKQGVSGIVHTGAGDAARNLAESLERARGCRHR